MLFSSHFVTKLVQVRLTVGNLLPPKRCLIIETQRANMSISKSFFIRCIVVLLGVPLSAQTISSRLVDAKTQKGIPYATVQYGEQLGVITNEEGRFSFVLLCRPTPQANCFGFGWGALPPDPPGFGWGAKAPQTPPLNYCP